MPVPRNLSGKFREAGPLTLYALLQRDDDNTDWVPGNVDSFLVEIFDRDAATSVDVPVWTKNYASATGYLVSRAAGVGAAPSGHNFKLQIGHDETDDGSVALDTISIGGHNLAVEVTFTSTLTDIDGVTAVWDPVEVVPRRT